MSMEALFAWIFFFIVIGAGVYIYIQDNKIQEYKDTFGELPYQMSFTTLICANGYEDKSLYTGLISDAQDSGADTGIIRSKTHGQNWCLDMVNGARVWFIVDYDNLPSSICGLGIPLLYVNEKLPMEKYLKVRAHIAFAQDTEVLLYNMEDSQL